jgi:hypothetical protein
MHHLAVGIRGVYGGEWDRDLAYRIGYFLPALLEADRILVGRDARESSPEVFEALSRGIRAPLIILSLPARTRWLVQCCSCGGNLISCQ